MNIQHYQKLHKEDQEARQMNKLTPEQREERAQAMVRLRYDERLTLQAIGKRYGLTRERVRQIINAYLAG